MLRLAPRVGAGSLTEPLMPETRMRLDPIHCLAKEAECRQLSTDGQLTPERRTDFLHMAETWAGLAKDSEPQEGK